MHHAGIFLERHQRGDVAGAGLAHPRDIVPREVDEHHVLGGFLGIEAEVGFHAVVLVAVHAAGAGAGNGLHFDDCFAAFASDADGGFGRGTEQCAIGHRHEEHVGAAVDRAGAGEGRERIGAGRAERARGDNLVHVAGEDMLLQLADGGGEFVIVEVRRHFDWRPGFDVQRANVRGAEGEVSQLLNCRIVAAPLLLVVSEGERGADELGR